MFVCLPFASLCRNTLKNLGVKITAQSPTVAGGMASNCLLADLKEFSVLSLQAGREILK